MSIFAEFLSDLPAKARFSKIALDGGDEKDFIDQIDKIVKIRFKLAFKWPVLIRK